MKSHRMMLRTDYAIMEDTVFNKLIRAAASVMFIPKQTLI